MLMIIDKFAPNSKRVNVKIGGVYFKCVHQRGLIKTIFILFININFFLFYLIALRYNTFELALFPIFEALLDLIFGMEFSSFSNSVFIFSMLAKRPPFMVISSVRTWKKSQGAMSGENGDWDIIIVLILVKNSRTSSEVWVGALSWCNLRELFFHNSEHFRRIGSRKQHITPQRDSSLTVRHTHS